MSIPYRANYRWHNHGKNLSSTVARYYEPTSTEEVQEIAREARQNGRKVRVVGDIFVNAFLKDLLFSDPVSADQ